MKKAVIFLLLFILFSSNITFAASSYVLPYPSTMPGGISYKLHLVWEKVSQYWYFGNFGQFEYNLKESDKYLIEAQTLFEYQQYLLGYNALQKSNEYFAKTLPNLESAKKNGKNIVEKRQLLAKAALKHSEVLEKMKANTPATVHWSPEKSASSELQIHGLLDDSLKQAAQYE